MQIFRSADRASTPWKNGGGMTAEIVARPVGSDLDTLEWRASLARIEQDGPFSSFPGVDRVLAVVEGQLKLSLAGGSPVTADSTTSPLRFQGEMDIGAQPSEGGASVLNILVRRDRWQAVAERMTVAPPRSIVVDGQTLIFAVDPLSVSSEEGAKALEALDLLHVEGPTTLRLSAPAASARVVIVRLSPV
ncbi:HutD/Ves family protein [Caulobacter sp. NIBR2454]|uniref:HutD/Ves family protein n=1 Tax=Caulobacter sp. NIBR2454 TaxID=3015996 RepID=UPI0022B63CA9|nr:HutD family protein [Caulobacter sp. NIBR2454]